MNNEYSDHINEAIDFLTKNNFFDEILTSALKPFSNKAILMYEEREKGNLVTFDPTDHIIATEILQVLQEKILFTARIQEDMLPLRTALEFLYNLFMMADLETYQKFVKNLSSLLDSRNSLQADILRLRDVADRLRQATPVTSLLEADVSREYAKLIRESFNDLPTESRRVPKEAEIEKKLNE